jgi:membrane-bound lytic murein transglycosylase D
VPNFIAATYLLTYYVEHNIKPAIAKTHYYQLDTICLSKGVHMSTIEQLTQWQSDDIAALNPVYKIRYIPGTEPKQCISGPLNEIGKLVSFGDSLYDLEKFIYSPKAKPTETLDTTNNAISDSTQTTGALEKPVIVWHKVRRGENLTIIADKYYVTVDDIRKWNYLRSNTAPLGRNLKIIKGKAPLNPPSTVTTPSPVQVETKLVQTKLTPTTPKQPITTQVEPEDKPITSQNTKGISSDKPFTSVSTTSTESTAPVVFDSIVTIYHTVQRNESIGLIADKYNVTPEQIKEWNKLSTNWIGVAQQLKIKINVKLMQPELANSLKDKTVKPQPKPVEKKRYYTVKPGDIFNRIADSHGITLEELKQLNPKIDPNSIRVGELIRVK